MISFSFNANVLTTSIDVVVPNAGTWTYKLTRTVPSNVEAAFIDDAIRSQFAERIETIRRREYLDGYRDGRAKRRKRDWFRSSLERSTT